METSLFNRLQATVLALATAGLILLAVLNLRQESQFQQPDDGVWWREVSGGLEAVKVLPNSPAQRAGIQQGDRLTAAAVARDVPFQHTTLPSQDFLGTGKPLAPSTDIPTVEVLPKNPIAHVADLERILYRTQVYEKASYAITRGGTPLDTPFIVILAPADRSLAQAQRVIGLVYLAIGIYVLFRRWGAARPRTSTSSAWFRFALYALKYTGKLDLLDWIVFWATLLPSRCSRRCFCTLR